MRTEGDCHKILKMLVNVAFMKGIVEQRKQLNLCKIMRLYCVPLEESDIVVEGEEGDAMYIILVGLFRVSIKGQMVAYLSQGSHFGELALEQHVTRNATVTSAEPRCEMLRIDRNNFRQAQADSQALQEEKLEFIRSLKFFENSSPVGLFSQKPFPYYRLNNFI